MVRFPPNGVRRPGPLSRGRGNARPGRFRYRGRTAMRIGGTWSRRDACGGGSRRHPPEPGGDTGLIATIGQSCRGADGCPQLGRPRRAPHPARKGIIAGWPGRATTMRWTRIASIATWRCRARTFPPPALQHELMYSSPRLGPSSPRLDRYCPVAGIGPAARPQPDAPCRAGVEEIGTRSSSPGRGGRGSRSGTGPETS